MHTKSWRSAIVAVALAASSLTPIAPASAEPSAEDAVGSVAATAAGLDCAGLNPTPPTTKFWNKQAGLYQNSAASLTKKDILVIGDSQVWSGSWVAQGIRKAGFNPIMYRCGGIGYAKAVSPSALTPGSVSYYDGVVRNKWYLPTGSPRAVYIQGSGNDSYPQSRQDEAARRIAPITAKLRQLYPNVPVIVTGPLGQGQRYRTGLTEQTSRAAAQAKVPFISYDKWITDYGYTGQLQDQYHFQDRYQYLLAAPMADSLTAALKGFTLYGATQTYVANNGGSARLGAPISKEKLTDNGGTWQAFSKKHTVYWSKFTGAHAVMTSGAIGSDFASHNYEHGSGYPIEDESAYAYGARQAFRRADGAQTRFYWSPNTGSRRMYGNGAIFNRWVAAGHANNLGFPISDETRFGDQGSVQYFRNRAGSWETALIWSAATGTHSIGANGAIYQYYLRNGSTNRFGYLTTDEYVDASGITRVRFSNGKTINWTAARGAWVS